MYSRVLKICSRVLELCLAPAKRTVRRWRAARHRSVLSEHSLLRYAALTLLYAAQGFPYGLLSVAMPAYMAQQGLTPAQIGSYLAIIVLPWSLKLINAPIMDRWSFLAMGRRRPWVLAAQAGMIGTSLALVLLPDPLEHLALLTACGFAINFFTAFQDVATDGMAIEIVPVEDQPRANSFMWGGKALGKAGAIEAGSWLLDGYGLSGAMVAHTAAVGVVMLVPLLLRERPGERLLPWTRGQASEMARHLQLEGWRDIGRSLLKVVVWPGSLRAAACTFVFSLGTGFLDALLPVLTVQELGWDHTDYSKLNARAGFVSALIGMVAGWMLIELLGRQRTIAAGAALLGLASVAMALMPELWAHRLTAQAYIAAYLLIDVLVTISFLSMMMAMCWQRVGATQFSLYMAIFNMGTAAGSGNLGPLKAVLSYPDMFLVPAATTATVVFLALGVDLAGQRRRLAELGDGGDRPWARPPDEPGMG